MIRPSQRLAQVSYEIRGPILERAEQLTRAGHDIIRLNIGNPAPFGFDAPAALREAVRERLAEAQGYTFSKGLQCAREAIARHASAQGVADVSPEAVFVGNGVSEMIMMSLQGLLNDGDEVLVPTPDYPLWTSAVRLAGGRAVHYRCDETAGWAPDVDALRRQITPRTRALVVINPNNPTGAVYPVETLRALAELAAEHRLVLFSDEIYDKILYDGLTHVPMASLEPDTLCVTFGGLSKNYRAAGFRTGWLVLSGRTDLATDYVSGLETLASMRLCGNVPTQLAVATALDGYPCVRDLVLPEGRLRAQRDLCYERLNSIPTVSCARPQGAFYAFPRLDTHALGFADDRTWALELLEEHHVLVVPGSGFNWEGDDHFRVVFLPDVGLLAKALDRLETFVTARLTSKLMPVGR